MYPRVINSTTHLTLVYMPRTTRPIVQLQGTSCTVGLLYARQYNLKGFFFYFGKTWNGKNYPFANVTFCCRSIKVRQWFFQAVVSSKKWTNKFNITTCRLFFIRFWKKVNTPKRHFEIKWPLAEIFFGNFWLCLPTGVQIAKKIPADGKIPICKSIVFANSYFGIILKITSGFWSVLHIHVYFECFSLPTLDFQIYVQFQNNLYSSWKCWWD